MSKKLDVQTVMLAIRVLPEYRKFIEKTAAKNQQTMRVVLENILKKEMKKGD
jgi:hypothetical protein